MRARANTHTAAMESRVEAHALGRGGGMNAKPTMFQAGLSNKFTKRHVGNYHDTTLTAASAAKARVELKAEKQAAAIEKQQEKIENEMKKIQAITDRLQRQQAREARRLRNRLNYAATRIQMAYRSHAAAVRSRRTRGAIDIQRIWRGILARNATETVIQERNMQTIDHAARVISRNLRLYVCRLLRQHELAWREYAATIIQCAVRRHQATQMRVALQRTHQLQERERYAATVIQAHTRGFLTRVVYMDVLYLICRIQSVVRGFLVRNRLRWLLSLNLGAIIALQAIVRGHLVRRRVKPLLDQSRCRQLQVDRSSDNDIAVAPRSRRRPTAFRLAGDKARVESVSNGVMLTHSPNPSRKSYALASMATMSSPSPQRIKRSFWLPNGSNSSSSAPRRRLPHLPVRRVTPTSNVTDTVSESISIPESAVAVVHVQRLSRSKLGMKRPPQRLAPIIDPCHRSVELDNDNEAEMARKALEERRAREESLRLKLLARKADERKRAESEASLRLELETEAKERKFMEREEKLVRLWMKTHQRMQREHKRRRQTVEQQREDRERMEMVREERRMRLHVKAFNRLNNTMGVSSKRTVEEDDNFSSARDDRDEDTAASAPRRLPRQQHKQRVSVVPSSLTKKKTKQRTKPTNFAQEKTHQLRYVYGRSIGHVKLNQVDSAPAADLDLQAKYASWNFHNDTSAEIVEDEAEFDYGEEFDEVIDESKLSQLLC